MRASKIPTILALLALVALIVAAPSHAQADTYQIYNLGSDQGYSFYGMNDTGLAVIENSSCGNSGCYYSFLDGTSTGTSFTAPTLIDDNGSSCTPAVPAGASVEHGTCNGSFEAFTGFLTPGQVHPNICVGPTYQDIFNGGEGLLYINGLGNIVFDDHFTDQWYEALDDTAVSPEPSSLLLLSTGVLALAITLRRRKQLS
jgi:hypothetical protein